MKNRVQDPANWKVDGYRINYRFAKYADVVEAPHLNLVCGNPVVRLMPSWPREGLVDGPYGHILGVMWELLARRERGEFDDLYDEGALGDHLHHGLCALAHAFHQYLGADYADFVKVPRS